MAQGAPRRRGVAPRPYYCPHCLVGVDPSVAFSLQLTWLHRAPLAPTRLLARASFPAPLRCQLTLPQGVGLAATVRDARVAPEFSLQLSPRVLLSCDDAGLSARFASGDGAHQLQVLPAGIRIATLVPSAPFSARIDAALGAAPSLCARFRAGACSCGSSVRFERERARCALFVERAAYPHCAALELAYCPPLFAPASITATFGAASDRLKWHATAGIERPAADLAVVARLHIGGRWREKCSIVSAALCVAAAYANGAAVDWRVGWHYWANRRTKLFVGKLHDHVLLSFKKKLPSGLVVKPGIAIGSQIGFRLVVVHPEA
jgi:hypothetical protein